jgi:hypothetical protein
MNPLSNFWLDLSVMIAAWIVFAAYITPRLIAHFMSTRDLLSSPLAEKFADFFAARALKQLQITPETILPKVMEWASAEENRPVLNKVLVNVLQTEAIGAATNIVLDNVKERIKAMLEGQIGAGRKEIYSAIEEAIPEQASAILKHPSVQTFLQIVQTAGQIATMFGKGKNVPPG